MLNDLHKLHYVSVLGLYCNISNAFLADYAGRIIFLPAHQYLHEYIASDGKNRVLEIRPSELHQRVSFFCGNQKMVQKAEEL